MVVCLVKPLNLEGGSGLEVGQSPAADLEENVLRLIILKCLDAVTNQTATEARGKGVRGPLNKTNRTVQELTKLRLVNKHWFQVGHYQNL